MTAPAAGMPLAWVTVPYRVRFDECGPDGLVRTSALLRYTQDIAWVHSERAGFDRDWYLERGLAWVVRTAEVGVGRPIPLGTTLTITTRVIGVRKVWARRRTEALLDDGKLAMWGHTDWVITDERGMPTRIPPEFSGRFGVPPGSFEPGHVPLPPTPPGAAVTTSTVRPQDLDPMGHVNNAAYLDYLEEAVRRAGPAAEPALAAVPRTVRLEYLGPAAPGSALVGQAWPHGEGHETRIMGWAWRLVDGDGRELTRGSLTSGDATLPSQPTEEPR